MKILLQRMREVFGALTRRKYHDEPVIDASADYDLVSPEAPASETLDAWRRRDVAERQEAAYTALLQKMYAGQPRQDFVVAAEAIRDTDLINPLLLEVGSGSGYYGEILSHLLRRPVRYVGLDYSLAMIQLALQRYPARNFIVANAVQLPFATGTFDIVLNGVSLMHIPNYQAAVSESRRVARKWCILHTVPLIQRRQTTFLTKRAYGEKTIEVIFNKSELDHLLKQNGLLIRHIYDSIPYDLETILGEPTVTKTYLCEVAGC